MNTAEKAYIAGIIDGEGTVTLVRKHKNENYSPEVSVANTNLELLMWLKAKIGSGTICKKQKKQQHHSLAYTIKIRGDKALKLLRDVGDYLLIKKKHASLLLDLYKSLTPRNGKYTSDMLKKKMDLVVKIRKFNSR